MKIPENRRPVQMEDYSALLSRKLSRHPSEQMYHQQAQRVPLALGF